MTAASGPLSFRFHRWTIDLPIEIEVQRNEDGEFAGRLPSLITLASGGEAIPADAITCINCGAELREMFGTECLGEDIAEG